jgi:hypothetical protein
MSRQKSNPASTGVFIMSTFPVRAFFILSIPPCLHFWGAVFMNHDFFAGFTPMYFILCIPALAVANHWLLNQD